MLPDAFVGIFESYFIVYVCGLHIAYNVISVPCSGSTPTTSGKFNTVSPSRFV